MDVVRAIPLWASVLLWIGLALLVALAIWTLVRAPGKRHDPGRRANVTDRDPRA